MIRCLIEGVSVCTLGDIQKHRIKMPVCRPPDMHAICVLPASTRCLLVNYPLSAALKRHFPPAYMLASCSGVRAKASSPRLRSRQHPGIDEFIAGARANMPSFPRQHALRNTFSSARVHPPIFQFPCHNADFAHLAHAQPNCNVPLCIFLSALAGTDHRRGFPALLFFRTHPAVAAKGGRAFHSPIFLS